MATLQHALTTIGRAAFTVRAVAGKLGPNHPATAQLAGAIYDLEVQASQVFAQITKRPVPAPNPQLAGTWTEAVRAYLGPVGQTVVPDGFVTYADNLTRYAESLVAGQTAAAGGVAAPRQAPGGFEDVPVASSAGGGLSPVTRKIIGALMGLIGAGASAGTAWALYRRGNPAPLAGTDTPEGAQAAAQKLFDNELPGAAMTLHPTPDGAWIASVRRGGRVIARHEATAIGDVVGTVVRHALGADVLDGEVVGEIVDAEPAVRRGKSEKIHEPKKPRASKPKVEKAADAAKEAKSDAPPAKDDGEKEIVIEKTAAPIVEDAPPAEAPARKPRAKKASGAPAPAPE